MEPSLFSLRHVQFSRSVLGNMGSVPIAGHERDNVGVSNPHHLVLCPVLIFGRGERPGAIRLAGVCSDLPLFASRLWGRIGILPILPGDRKAYDGGELRPEKKTLQGVRPCSVTWVGFDVEVHPRGLEPLTFGSVDRL